MKYTVNITLHTKRALTEKALIDLAEIGGVAEGRPGERRVETTLTVEAPNVRQAADRAIERVTERVAGTVVAFFVMTIEEADRRLADRDRIVGVTEVAEMLGVSKQRISMLSQREDFPRPLEQLASGPVWRARDLSTFSAGWRRKPGRPPKTAQSGG